ncbi:peptidase S8/S53 domain-containing protein [Crucibulum laeve]|uniref:Peptidase S8/S53 domain-containing protein n=1 Tax=Crucibulum laeve TaxID=68775 RepID=A0A5C3MF59_9AGAR|nr:peptidase S8/S53 domain-containing protein [Crucibulum laeve]
MRFFWAALSAFLIYHSFVAASPAKRSYDTHNYYVIEHNHQLAQGASLDDVASALGVEVVEQAGELEDHWLVRALKPSGDIHARSELSDPVLDTFEILKAAAELSLTSRSTDTLYARTVISSVKYLSRQTLRQREKRAPPPVLPPLASSSRAIAERLGIQDPMFSQQWHLVNDEFPEHMMNATPVWEMGYTGKGVISSLVDDGLDYTSEDLAENFDADDSYDFNDHEDLPTPKNYDDHHGTRCAGQVAAVKNNVCGVGIAYESKVAGVRILSGPISDVDETAALNYGFQNVSIYSCSWGPPDNGQSMEGPGYLIKKALVNGINNGRSGKGSIFVFASGNGAAHGDQCNFDGYTNSIYSVTVSAVDYKGMHPYYSESCAANMIVAYSSGAGHHIVTTDKGKNACATTHGGTSAAAPNAVGVFALALQARPDLTWRDIQYLCVETARMINPEDPDWEKISNNRLYSYKYGFGVLDASRYITAAKEWKLVKPQAWFHTKTVQLEGGTYSEEKSYSGGQFIGPDGVESKISITKDMLSKNNFETLEHINVKVWIHHTKRGDVEVEVISPNGIKSILGGKRESDSATTGYPGWIFMSVKHWGEDPVGEWTIRVSDQNKPAENNGTFLGWNMVFWGTTIDSSKAQKYEVPLVENTLPPVEAPARPIIPAPTSTKQLTKPTANLPGDHGSAEGENSKPAFSSAAVDAAAPTASSTTTSTPTPDEGWFSDMSNLVSNQKWFFGAIGAVALFGIGAAIFFWRRRITQRRAAYDALAGGEDVSMSAFVGGGMTAASGGPRTTRELYDAFGEVSDDDDADESTGLTGGRPIGRSTGGLGFHSGFLDDDEPSTAGGGTTPKYRDEPNTGHTEMQVEGHDDDDRMDSPSGSGGSWEHASRES